MRRLATLLSYATAMTMGSAALFCVAALPAALRTRVTEPEDLLLIFFMTLAAVLVAITSIINGITLKPFRWATQISIALVHALNGVTLALGLLLGIAMVIGDTATTVESLLVLVPGGAIAVAYWQVLATPR